MPEGLPTGYKGAVTKAYVDSYGSVIVKVIPYRFYDGYREVEVYQWVGDEEDRGGYLVGRGTMVKKDGTVGVRTILVSSSHTPPEVQIAARALFH